MEDEIAENGPRSGLDNPNPQPAGGTRNKVKIVTVRKLVLLGIVLVIALIVSTQFAGAILQPQYIRYLQISEVAIIGYFIIDVTSMAFYRLTVEHSEETAKTVKSLSRIVGSIAVTAILISYLSQNPVVAVSISTITGIVVGFASQNIIGNLIAGMYLVLARPFRIGDRVVVFDKAGIVSNIELLYCKIFMDQGDIMLVPNSALVTTSIILKKKDVSGGRVSGERRAKEK